MISLKNCKNTNRAETYKQICKHFILSENKLDKLIWLYDKYDTNLVLYIFDILNMKFIL